MEKSISQKIIRKEIHLLNDEFTFNENAVEDKMKSELIKKENWTTENKMEKSGAYEQIKHEGIDLNSEFVMDQCENIKLEPQLNTEVIIKDEIFNENDLERQETYNGMVFSCNECSKTYSCENDLIDHQKLHTVEKSFICEICDKTFTEQYNLNKHKLIHNGEKRTFTCEICDKKFTLNHILLKHKRIHTGEKPFSCEICDKKFTWKHHVVEHKRIHSGDKPFTCEICDKKFTKKNHLIVHKRLHSGEKPFTCDVCDKKFTLKHHLNSHQRIHTGEIL